MESTGIPCGGCGAELNAKQDFIHLQQQKVVRYSYSMLQGSGNNFKDIETSSIDRNLNLRKAELSQLL